MKITIDENGKTEIEDHGMFSWLLSGFFKMCGCDCGVPPNQFDIVTDDDDEITRELILSDEDAYDQALGWMVRTSQDENNHEYVEDGVTFTKNSEELFAEYLDRYVDHVNG